ncbi:BLUF domain-containing protein [Marivirga arenosa]|uniref:BLUF domain-containing protein n=1 Tax=Marivirga arenosa TaxID=3059076 RepID=A0AA49GCL2_9BACT|nr:MULTISPECIES: BLUF domain-containing protein [unclassified Marivirga]WKK82069.2 BLUF domain-containing protein [Marivirga sp. BKB1-2]WKK87236.2 BLUF domain-containing protein [Marivirga sp. ABR2-2]
MLSQLVYVSDRVNNSEKEIENILQACKKNNPDLGITGALLYSDKKFLQLVEGENDTIMTLYDKIKDDHRHKNCIMLSYMPITKKSFPSWHMGSKKIGSNEIEFDTSINSAEKQIFSNLLDGKEENGSKTKQIIQKFF